MTELISIQKFLIEVKEKSGNRMRLSINFLINHDI